jgi:hypothetical protein
MRGGQWFGYVINHIQAHICFKQLGFHCGIQILGLKNLRIVVWVFVKESRFHYRLSNTLFITMDFIMLM